MSELYEKESEIKDISGWGYEYSFKLKKNGELEPPQWVVTPLQKLARYVFNQCTPFNEAHFIHFGTAIMPEINEYLDSFVFSVDPIVGSINTSTGSLVMLEVFCITKKDLDYRFSTDSGSIELVAAIRRKNPYFINDFSCTINYSEILND